MPESEVFHSPALHLGPLEVVEKPSRARRRLRGALAKLWVSSFLATGARKLPAPVQRGGLRLFSVPVQLAAPLPGNQLLSACRTLSTLAARAGYHHPPRRMYRDFVDGVRRMLQWGSYALGGRPDETAAHLRIRQPDLMAGLLAEHGGCVLCVPHCTGAVLMSLEVSRRVPTVLLARNPRSIARTRQALAVYESLGVKVLLVRDGNPFALTRACLRLLRSGTLVVATVDRICRDSDRVLVPMFGGVASVAPWASRMAAKAGVPVVPGFTHTRRTGIELDCGEPVRSTDADELMRVMFAYFERQILEDPASWSFLGDRRWRWVIEDALAGSRRTDGGVRRPSRPDKKIPAGRLLEPA
ncbi:MAG: hypothetical protein QNJ90_01760 [Planctomycetota bacterium]|nr:hypothetical protein [Planctomycetota bacterium]